MRTPTCAPRCAACSAPAKRELVRDGNPFCSSCWSDVPTKARKALKAAASDLARWPSTTHVRAAHDVALRAAVAAARGRR
ncbi:hypothetical protein [Nocardioides marmoraquaticus]